MRRMTSTAGRKRSERLRARESGDQRHRGSRTGVACRCVSLKSADWIERPPAGAAEWPPRWRAEGMVRKRMAMVRKMPRACCGCAARVETGAAHRMGQAAANIRFGADDGAVLAHCPTWLRRAASVPRGRRSLDGAPIREKIATKEFGKGVLRVILIAECGGIARRSTRMAPWTGPVAATYRSEANAAAVVEGMADDAAPNRAAPVPRAGRSLCGSRAGGGNETMERRRACFARS